MKGGGVAEVTGVIVVSEYLGKTSERCFLPGRSFVERARSPPPPRRTPAPGHRDGTGQPGLTSLLTYLGLLTYLHPRRVCDRLSLGVASVLRFPYLRGAVVHLTMHTTDHELNTRAQQATAAKGGITSRCSTACGGRDWCQRCVSAWAC